MKTVSARQASHDFSELLARVERGEEILITKRSKPLALLVAGHGPHGPTEEHLVEEIAGILWRKRRLRLAEAAAHRRGLDGTLASYREAVKVALVHLDTAGQSERVVDAIRATAADTEGDIADMTADEVMTRRALDLLGSKRNDAYEAALAALREDTQVWWADLLARDPDEMEEGEEYATADAESLRRFLEGEVLPWFENRKKELARVRGSFLARIVCGRARRGGPLPVGRFFGLSTGGTYTSQRCLAHRMRNLASKVSEEESTAMSCRSPARSIRTTANHSPISLLHSCAMLGSRRTTTAPRACRRDQMRPDAT
jgi:prevent-host-death family protein